MGKIRNKIENILHMPIWRRNIYVLWVVCFVVGMGFSEVVPFLSFYIDDLGDFSKSQLNFYSGIVFAATYVMTALTSPMWGKLADRTGRKPMILRTSLGTCIAFLCMGLSRNVWQLLFFRGLQGIFGGTISNATALVAIETPEEEAGHALGILTTGTTAGNLLGPMLGGFLASLMSYRNVFFVTVGLMFTAFLLCVFFVKETRLSVANKKLAKQSFVQVFKNFAHPRLILGLFITTMIIQVSNTSINPFLSLYVREIVGKGFHLTLLAGIVSAIPGVATILVAPKFGEMGDKIGSHKMLTFGFALAIIVIIPMSFVRNIWQLIILRFILGISDATMMPAINTLLAKNTPHTATSRTFAYNQSFMSIGGVMGPAVGTFVATWFADYRYVFLTTAGFVVFNMVLFLFNSKVLWGRK
ncbi:MAG: MFS transporter [Lachnospiraceae bacterium]|jgi:DHA1 family multidrug resistance protein-like MFS transporter|nr:MFS transporter [Lachnospiraceae bacterium]